MKNILSILIVLFLSMNLYSQVRNYSDIPKYILDDLDKMGVDSLPLLNSYESAYLNVIYNDSLNGFDLTNKKIGFLYHGVRSSKEEYFKDVREWYYRNETTISESIYIFDETQKMESGGYDGAIVYWNKFLIPKNEIARRLKKWQSNVK